MSQIGCDGTPFLLPRCAVELRLRHLSFMSVNRCVSHLHILQGRQKAICYLRLISLTHEDSYLSHANDCCHAVTNSLVLIYSPQ